MEGGRERRRRRWKMSCFLHFCLGHLAWEYLMLKAKSMDIISLPQTQQLRIATENRLAKVPPSEPGDLYSDRRSLFSGLYLIWVQCDQCFQLLKHTSPPFSETAVETNHRFCPQKHRIQAQSVFAWEAKSMPNSVKETETR